MPGPIPSSPSRSPSLNDVLAAGGSANLDEVVPVKPPPPPTEHQELERISHRKHEAVVGRIHIGAETSSVLKHLHAPLFHGLPKGIGPISTAHFLGELAFGPNNLNPGQQAQLRQTYALTTARLASNVLPPSYLAAKVEPQTPATTTVLTGMIRTLERKLGSAEKAEEAMRGFQAEAERGATAGMKHAGSHGLRSEGARDALLAKDRGFRERYNTDLTFRAGVDAMVWLGTNQPAEFDQRRASLSGQAARGAGAR